MFWLSLCLGCHHSRRIRLASYRTMSRYLLVLTNRAPSSRATDTYVLTIASPYNRRKRTVCVGKRHSVVTKLVTPNWDPNCLCPTVTIPPTSRYCLLTLTLNVPSSIMIPLLLGVCAPSTAPVKLPVRPFETAYVIVILRGRILN